MEKIRPGCILKMSAKLPYYVKRDAVSFCRALRTVGPFDFFGFSEYTFFVMTNNDTVKNKTEQSITSLELPLRSAKH